MQFTIEEIVVLAQTYLDNSDISPWQLGREILGANDRIFPKLLDGGDCYSRHAAEISAWFIKEWPKHVNWPKGVPREPSLISMPKRRPGRPANQVPVIRRPRGRPRKSPPRGADSPAAAAG
jgi:hypothetical protein